MQNSMVTVIAPVAPAEVGPLRSKIADTLGNPAHDHVREALEDGGAKDRFLHFASLHALQSRDSARAFLVLEMSADGNAGDALARFAALLRTELEPIFSRSSAWRKSDTLESFLSRHVVNVGTRLFSTVGLNFCGTPGQSVPDTIAEGQLADRVGELLSKQTPGMPPLQRLWHVRDKLRTEPEFSWALGTPPPPVSAPERDSTLLELLPALALPFLARFLWPVLLVLVPLAAYLAWPEPLPWPPAAVVSFIFEFLLWLLLGIALVLGGAYAAFRRQERRDWISDRAPHTRELSAIVERENAPRFVQNHMMSQTTLKPGLLRKLTIRLAFWVVQRITARNPRPGHLGDIGTIHFARWVKVPGTRDLLFFSNYGGSWESYLEDFITKANQGLTGVWSNTTGFPRTTNLFFDGATDGERFKRYARQSMVHTPFWYSAYSHLTTANIRTNRLIRRGLAAAMTQDEAVRWLALFGSSPRPSEKLEVTQIQSIVFGGLGFKPAGKIMLIDLPHDEGKARNWLDAVAPHIAFGDGRYLEADAVLTLGVSARALEKLGLPASAVETFPPAFVCGMTGPGRSNILGDTGRNAPEHWAWGRGGEDIALLVYGNDDAAADDLEKTVSSYAAKNGATVVRVIPLERVRDEPEDRKEPFGFIDGVSQPAIRNTYRGRRNDDPIHLIEPGEIVVGYPDNRGNIPPGPRLDARHDPEHRLPIEIPPGDFGRVTAEQPRAVGHNGSFLVIRQLEQDVEGFWKFCSAEAARLKPQFAHLPVECDDEFIAAKMIGRWKDGASLVRFPYLSATMLKQRSGRDSTLATARAETRPADAKATPIPPSDARQEPPTAAKAPRPDNDLLYGTEDPQGLRCPYGAHIRRANPRDSFKAGSDEQIAISNRHRTLRVGRLYSDGKTRGLMFMCLNGDLERQFEFIQQTWMGSSKFHGLNVETDPIVTDGTTGRCGFTIPTRSGPVSLSPLPQFVTVRGGGYFFVPGKQLLDFLRRV